jgi:hypothetical protein
MTLAEILADKDFGLQMRFVRDDVTAFFRPREKNGEVLSERRKWLGESPETYMSLLPPGEGLLEETIRMAIELGTLPAEVCWEEFADLAPIDRCRWLGELWEADFLLMRPDEEGVFRLYGGCLCFPSHWDLGDKMEKPMLAIHAPVPGLNEALGRQIDGFLRKIKPGISWERFNWGLSASPELNLHPSRDLPRLHAGVGAEEVWWRLEEQSLVALPESGGILFGIKLVVKPLSEIKADPDARQGLIRALRTMPERMADYKGITPARERLVALLEG